MNHFLKVKGTVTNLRKLCKDSTIATAGYEDATGERAVAILIAYSPRNAYFSEVFSNTNNSIQKSHCSTELASLLEGRYIYIHGIMIRLSRACGGSSSSLVPASWLCDGQFLQVG